MYDPAGMLVALASLGATKQQARFGRSLLRYYYYCYHRHLLLLLSFVIVVP